MKILLLEPYYTGSHKQWADGLKKYSNHEIKILSMKGQFWKWRMHGGAITLAKQFNNLNWRPDLLLATDMLDLSTFLSLTREKSHGIPTGIYFHENQLSYPWSPDDRDIKKNRDNHYGFVNYASSLVADRVFFNSSFHMNSFLDNLQSFLKHFPDHQELDTIDMIDKKSQVIHLGLDLSKFDDEHIQKNNEPIILWNHRWEYDKNPEQFFKILEKVKENGYVFKLVVAGENFRSSPSIFDKAKKKFASEIIHWGYIKLFNDYRECLLKADILPVTSNQEFFGASVMEAIYCGLWPILPYRLSYPELIPGKSHSNHLYKNEKELYEMIIWAIENCNKIRVSKISSVAARFDWKTMAPVYDKIFELF